MKKSRLLEIIQEEIQNVLNEVEDPIQTAFTKAITRDGDVKLGGTGMGNIMRPKLIDIIFTDNRRFYKALIDGKTLYQEETEALIKNLTNISIDLSRMNEEKLDIVYDILKSKNIKLTWSDVFDPS